MEYKILEAYVITDEKASLIEVVTLWEDGDSVRATYINRDTSHLPFKLSKVILSEKLLQRTAKWGLYLNKERKEKYFPHIDKKKWSK